ncbi:MAG: phosphate ABC transporter permease PstA [Armatimonadetes bacterium]|nr:phosphate ABC transporter permease PstA [Armatimonadota bacterium]
MSGLAGSRTSLRRRLTNLAMLGLCWLGAGLAVLPLVLVLYYVATTGLRALNLDFFTQLPRPVGEPGGGMKPAILGSLEIVGIASVLGLLVGILGGIYLAEYPNHRMVQGIQFTADVLSSVPSIVLGVVAYALLVVPMRRFSALAGGVALAFIMTPIVLRTTEEMIRLVPGSLREASLALGAPRWRTAISAVLPVARAGIVTGALLAVARVAGETAPLLFTALNNQYLNFRPDQPTASLPVQIYTYAISPYDDWHRLAWAGALVLVGLIALLSLLTRLAIRGRALE